MHDDVVTLIEDHLRRLEEVRRRLCASRQVRWGERGAALAESVAASRRFVLTAADLLAQVGDATASTPETSAAPCTCGPADRPLWTVDPAHECPTVATTDRGQREFACP